jgi:exodeoxyribonuclease V alpha subunit
MYYAVIQFDDGHMLEYLQEDLKHVSLAWCTTVHKSQGSEFPTVIQIVSKAHPSMLKRNLVYTGITRARTNVAIIGERDALKMAVENNSQEVRYTLLANRLRKALQN